MSDASLDVIDPPAETVQVGGQSVALSPVTIERMPRFARALRPLLPVLGEALTITEDTQPGVAVDILTEIFELHGDGMIEAVAIALAPDLQGIEAMRARVGKLQPDAFLVLAIKCARVNADFFARRLLPAVLQAVQAAQMAPPGTGPTPSKP